MCWSLAVFHAWWLLALLPAALAFLANVGLGLMYVVLDPQESKAAMAQLRARILWCSHRCGSRLDPHGLFIGRVGGRWFMGVSTAGAPNDNGSLSINVTLLCGRKTAEALLSAGVADDAPAALQTVVPIYANTSSSEYPYIKMCGNVTCPVRATPGQQVVVEAFMEMASASQDTHNGMTAVVNGAPGGGKSTLAHLLAASLGASLYVLPAREARTFNLHALLHEVQPSAEAPLLILLDEVDCLVKQQPDRKTWCNQLLDDISWASNVFCLATTNVSFGDLTGIFVPKWKKWLLRMKDRSAFRLGRCHLYGSIGVANDAPGCVHVDREYAKTFAQRFGRKPDDAMVGGL
jgi:hypothetical protein